jgi:uncharacterized protein (DUF924 family)
MVTLGNPPEPIVLVRQRQLRKTCGPLEQEINERFTMDFKKLADGDSDNWYDDSDGVLAIIIMF